MRLAYLAFDKNCSHAIKALGSFFNEIDVYVLESEKPQMDCDFSALSIMTSGLRIPADVNQRTFAHQEAFAVIEKEYRGFKNNLSKASKSRTEALRPNVNSLSVNFYSIKDIRQFSYGRVSGCFVVHSTTDKNSTDYDYLIIQNSQSLTEELAQLKQNVFSVTGEQRYLVLCLNFAVTTKLPAAGVDSSSVYIKSISNRSIMDNWYICNLTQKDLQVSLFVPREQSGSASYIDFIAARTREVMKEAFIAFDVGELNSTYVYDCDGFAQQEIKLKKPKVSAVFPAFTFWSPTEINNYVSSCFSVKNRKEAV